ncbi:GNAT family N-acetyltransferase [Methyloversatilis sp.]|uniref:GNAT family N-acetyltransferase n=2 Tax=Methyloversatilis sp. TaxID=2569862 RepID=UPI0027376F38|nr:GNAT family N-acetyltransferase [Methyloversatilis sp.]MDP3454292.1 GNAT family N-acetyltransferase [Methyloversatilis sp.]MDP3579677.1 GNAT family N-acetyltransferase [Methyloversatilis sp.]
MPTLRHATPADVPGLCALLAQLFAQEAEFVADAATQARGLQRILEAPDSGDILVLAEDGCPVGMVSLLYLTSTALGSRVALLEDMVVQPGQRGRGCGSRLLKAAIDCARQRGCRRITLLTDGHNLDAQRFYRQHGFAGSDMKAMRLMLD